MRWLELIVLVEAAGDLVLASSGCLYFGRYAVASGQAARRVGAAALTLVHAGLVLEATTFLVFADIPAGLELMAVFALRSLLLASLCFVQLLVWRQSWVRRP